MISNGFGSADHGARLPARTSVTHLLFQPAHEEGTSRRRPRSSEAGAAQCPRPGRPRPGAAIGALRRARQPRRPGDHSVQREDDRRTDLVASTRDRRDCAGQFGGTETSSARARPGLPSPRRVARRHGHAVRRVPMTSGEHVIAVTLQGSKAAPTPRRAGCGTGHRCRDASYDRCARCRAWSAHGRRCCSPGAGSCPDATSALCWNPSPRHAALRRRHARATLRGG